MHENNEIYHNEYATKIYKNYINELSSLDVIIIQNELIENINLFSHQKKSQHHNNNVNINGHLKHIKALHHYIEHLMKNIKFFIKTKRR